MARTLESGRLRNSTYRRLPGKTSHADSASLNSIDRETYDHRSDAHLQTFDATFPTGDDDTSYRNNRYERNDCNNGETSMTVCGFLD
jgi:hypothetical protein